MFKAVFKKYKAKSTSLDLSHVINFDETDNTQTSLAPNDNTVQRLDICNETELELLPGLKSRSAWKAYALKTHPGLLVIRNPFTERGLRYWIARCLRDYPRPPNIVNLNARLFDNIVREDWWKELNLCSDSREIERIKEGMRWTTFGYHHNWDTKIYDEHSKSPFPKDLSSLCRFFANILGFQDYRPEAAIVNYYPIGSSLSGHTDHSEPNRSAPLFSFSFGQTAIFLIGGTTLEETPSAILLQSGDVLIMSEESRLSYHAVPRIIQTHNTSTAPLPKEPVLGSNLLDSDLFQRVGDSNFWEPFDNYIKDSRININVRQVLSPSDLTLCSNKVL
ncbi:hypothetical protein KR009_007323 [Drosophila setifemur]|nr:hypothetical protein KR009_007323 [Drosophila setifemur]